MQITSGSHCLSFIILQCLMKERVDFAQLDKEAMLADCAA